MHVMVLTYGEPKQGYLNFTLGNLWATQPIALLIWPPLQLVRILPVQSVCSGFIGLDIDQQEYGAQNATRHFFHNNMTGTFRRKVFLVC